MARRRGSPWSVYSWLTWLVLACLLPGIVGAVVLFIHEYHVGRDRLEQNILLAARSLVQAVDSQLFRAMAVAETLSTSRFIATRDFAGFHAQAREVLALVEPGVEFVLTDRNGQQIVDTQKETDASLPRHSDPERIRRVFASGLPVISELFVDESLHRPLVTVDVPVVLEGEVTYVLSIVIRPEDFNAILRAQGLPPDWVAAIFDSTGSFVALTHSQERFLGQKAAQDFIAHIGAVREGSFESTTREGLQILSIYSRSSATQWTAGIGIPRQTINQAVLNSLALLAAILLSLFVIGVGLARFIGRRIALSIEALTVPAVALGAGKPALVPRVHTREAAEVAAALGRAAEMLQERTRALEKSIAERQAAQAEVEESHARLEAILDSLKEGVIVFDLGGNVLEMNPVALMLHGYVDPFEARRRVSEFAEIFELRSLDGRLLTVDEWPLSRVLGGESFSDYEFELRRRDNGRSRIVSNSGTLVCNAHGRPILGVLTIRDISERKQAEEEIRVLNAELESRVRQRTAELERSNEALLRSNMELQRFAHAAAHDLQTPLRSIAGFAQLLQRELAEHVDSQTEEWLMLMVDSTKRLQVLIQELLAYSRLEAQAHPFEATDLRQTCSQVAATLADFIGKTGAEVNCGDLPSVMADRIQMAQLLQNLVENGIKYNQSQPPRVSITGERRESEWLFSVADNGIGIEPKHQQRIFEIFRRLHTYADIPGTGIGLAICQRIVERHGGRIWVESKPGEGSTFHFTLPDRQA